MKNFKLGHYGGSGMVKYSIFSSHGCQRQHALNFLELEVLDLKGGLPDLCIRS